MIEEQNTMTCPSCGFVQKKSLECMKCGIVISKFKKREDDRHTATNIAETVYSPDKPQKSQKSFSIKGVAITIFAVGFVLYCLFDWVSSRPVMHGRGEVAPDQPIQEETDTEKFKFKGYTIHPLASYHITARVLSTKRYYFGREAELSPVDLALGWGPMSNESTLASIKIKQSGRFYYWSTKKFPIPKRDICENSANTHIIPADDDIEKRLKKVRIGNVVEIKGYLIRAHYRDGWYWKSSLNRTDTGNGACEVFFAEELEVVK